MEDDRVPEDDQQCAVLLGVPAPEAAPGLVRPDAAQHGPDEAEEQGEADDPIGHRGQRPAGRRIEAPRDLAPQRVGDGQRAGQEGSAVPDGDGHHVGRQPEVRIEHRAHHLHGVAVAH